MIGTVTDAGKYCWGRGSFILICCHGYGSVVPKLLRLVSPQTELQEVLGADEETGPLDGDKTASPGGSEEEKGQEDTEAPVQTAPLTASIPAAQVGSGGILCASDAPLCLCVTCTLHGLRRKAAVTLSRVLLQQLLHAEAEHEKLLGGWPASKASLFSQTTPCSRFLASTDCLSLCVFL